MIRTRDGRPPQDLARSRRRLARERGRPALGPFGLRLDQRSPADRGADQRLPRARPRAGLRRGVRHRHAAGHRRGGAALLGVRLGGAAVQLARVPARCVGDVRRRGVRPWRGAAAAARRIRARPRGAGPPPRDAAARPVGERPGAHSRRRARGAHRGRRRARRRGDARRVAPRAAALGGPARVPDHRVRAAGVHPCALRRRCDRAPPRGLSLRAVRVRGVPLRRRRRRSNALGDRGGLSRSPSWRRSPRPAW